MKKDNKERNKSKSEQIGRSGAPYPARSPPLIAIMR